MHADPLLHLAIHNLPGLRTREKLLLAERTGSIDAVRLLTRESCERIIGRSLRTRLFDPQEACARAQADAKDLTMGRFGYTFYGDCEYPPLLREIYDPPFLLFFRGNRLSADAGTEEQFLGTGSCIAVVGTRYPTGNGRKAAYRLGKECAERRISVVSGLAVGIDEAVHRGVVDAGGHAVAVLGNGIDTVYPWANRKLARRIIESGGTILSEYGPGIEPRRYHFPARNRIIAGCSRGTVVIEAPARSGALITADFALEDGRDLFVHGKCLSGARSEGVAALARDGATVISGAVDIVRNWMSSEAEIETSIAVVSR